MPRIHYALGQAQAPIAPAIATKQSRQLEIRRLLPRQWDKYWVKMGALHATASLSSLLPKNTAELAL